MPSPPREWPIQPIRVLSTRPERTPPARPSSDSKKKSVLSSVVRDAACGPGPVWFECDITTKPQLARCAPRWPYQVYWWPLPWEMTTRGSCPVICDISAGYQTS